MQIGEALSYPFQDKKWIEKIAIAAVLILTIIGAIAVVGWVVEIIRRVLRSDPEPLAPWSDIGRYFVDGLQVIAIGFIWMLPFMFLNLCTGVFTGLASSVGGDDATVGTLSGLVTLCLSVISLPYSIAASFLMIPMYGVFAMGGSFGEALNPARAWRLAKVNLGGYIVAWLLAGLIAGLSATVGILLCIVGVFALSAYAAAVSGHLYGQANREAMASLPAA